MTSMSCADAICPADKYLPMPILHRLAAGIGEAAKKRALGNRRSFLLSYNQARSVSKSVGTSPSVSNPVGFLLSRKPQLTFGAENGGAEVAIGIE